MPTVFHVVEATFAGVGRHVLDLVEAQARRGIDVHVFAGSSRQSASFARARRDLSDVTWYDIDMDRLPGPSDIRVLRMLRGLIRSARPDVLHGHSTKGGLLARCVPAGDAAVVYTPHAPYAMNPALNRWARRTVTAMERWLAKRTDAIVAVSPEEASFLAEIGVSRANLFTVPNGIDPVNRVRSANVRRHLGLPLNRPIVGFVGRLEHQKAPDDLIRIFEGLAKKRPAVCFAVVGSGSLRPLLMDAADRPPLQGRLHIVGPQEGPWAMSAFDVLVLPSRYEGFPYVLLEAAFLGLPSVVSDRATSSMLTSGPATVRRVGVGDTASFVIQIDSLLASGMSSAMSEAERVERFGVDRRFTIEEMATATMAVYRSVCPGCLHFESISTTPRVLAGRPISGEGPHGDSPVSTA